MTAEKSSLGASTSCLGKGMEVIITSALVLLLTACGATPSPAAIPSPTALVTVPPAVTPPPPTTPVPPPTPTATPVLNEVEGLTPIPQSTPVLSPARSEVEGAALTEEIIEPNNERSLLTITIVYDNNAYDPRLKTAWGFSCLIEYRGQVILFDTGGDSPTLLANMATLGTALLRRTDPSEIEAVVLSHIHGDHTGGLSGILEMAGDGLTVFVPRSFPARFKDAVRTRAQPFDPSTSSGHRKLRTSLVEVREPREISEEVYTTGELGTGIIEQSLAVRTDEGLVVVTGCVHPGIVEVVRKARALSGDGVYLVLGGFHLGGKSQREIEGIISEFRRLGVRKVAPCHCTGEQAIKMFRQEYGEDFIQAGAGKVIRALPSE